MNCSRRAPGGAPIVVPGQFRGFMVAKIGFALFPVHHNNTLAKMLPIWENLEKNALMWQNGVFSILYVNVKGENIVDVTGKYLTFYGGEGLKNNIEAGIRVILFGW